MARKLKSVLDYHEYKVDIAKPLNWRLAMFLDWAAQEMPGRAIPYQHVAKIIMMKSRMPSPDSTEVRQIKSAITRARGILLAHFRRGLRTVDGVGIRATTDDTDLVKHQVENDVRRLKQVADAVDRSVSVVNASAIKDRDVRKRFSAITRFNKALRGPNMLDNLRILPPKKDEEDDEE